MSKLEFKPIPNYNLQVATSGDAQSRILVFASQDTLDGHWERVEGAQILIVGSDARRELTRFVKSHGRPSASEFIPGGIAGRAYPALRKHLGIA